MAVFRLGFGDLEHDRETVILLDLRDVSRLAVEREIIALDLEAVGGRGLRRDRRTADRDHRLYPRITGIGDLDRLVRHFGSLVAAIQRGLERGSVDIERKRIP